jgi:hypothetical protein
MQGMNIERKPSHCGCKPHYGKSFGITSLVSLEQLSPCHNWSTLSCRSHYLVFALTFAPLPASHTKWHIIAKAQSSKNESSKNETIILREETRRSSCEIGPTTLMAYNAPLATGTLDTKEVSTIHDSEKDTYSDHKHNIDRLHGNAANDHSIDTNFQAGVQKAEAITIVWTLKALVIAYIAIWCVYFVQGIVAGVSGALIPYVTSDFAAHSLIPMTSVLSQVIGGATNLCIAKILDIFGRPHGFLFCVSLVTIDFIMAASCNGVEAYAASPDILHYRSQRSRVLSERLYCRYLITPPSRTFASALQFSVHHYGMARTHLHNIPEWRWMALGFWDGEHLASYGCSSIVWIVHAPLLEGQETKYHTGATEEWADILAVNRALHARVRSCRATALIRRVWLLPLAIQPIHYASQGLGICHDHFFSRFRTLSHCSVCCLGKILCSNQLDSLGTFSRSNNSRHLHGGFHAIHDHYVLESILQLVFTSGAWSERCQHQLLGTI